MASGRFIRIVTRGRHSGEPRAVTVGFAEVEAGAGRPSSLVVAAGAPDSAWALNLLAEPACLATIGERSFNAIAEPLTGADHAAAIRASQAGLFIIVREWIEARSASKGHSQP